MVLNSNERLKYGEKGYLYSCKEIEKNFQTLRRSGTYIADISWIDTTGRISSTNEIIRKDSYYDNPCMKDLCECKENIVYTGFYDRSPYLLVDDHTPVFSVGQNIYDIYCPNLKIGFLELDIYTDALKNNVSFIPSGTDSNAILTDKDNKIILKNENISKSNIIQKTYTFENGWTLEIGCGNEAVIRNLKENLKGFVGVAVVILILSVICASYFAWSISNPLGKLTASMSLMKANGKFKNIEVNSNLKEINTLEITYNAMVVSLEEMLRKNAAIQRETNKAKLLALQTQINPHFLANSFETIRALAIKSESYEVEKAADALAKMYRYVLNDKTHIVCLKDEINYVKNYIRMQEFRFGKKVQIFYRIQQELYDFPILCLTIQPLVENVYCHGLKDEQKTKIMIIEAVLENDNLRIVVSDNGCGMSPAQLQYVHSLLAANITSKVISEESPRTGIGLVNVNNRLVLYYGKESGITIESEAGKGTKVSFRIKREKVVPDESFDN
ncbi:MAG: sensor histidine kinase [Blautia wexlerae]